jgi:hypothetical protein
MATALQDCPLAADAYTHAQMPDVDIGALGL